MTKREINKALSNLYMELQQSIDNIDCRLEVIDSVDNPTDKHEEEAEKLNDILELLKELIEKIEEI